MKKMYRLWGLLLVLTLCMQVYAQEIDSTFNPMDRGFGPGEGASWTVRALSVQSDGKILIGGGFTSYNGTGKNRVARLLNSKATPSTVCSCVQNVTVTLNDTTCQFVLQPGIIRPGCIGATVRVMDNNPLNKDTIDCAGVWTYGLFSSEGTLLCWGKVTVEDKSGPKLVEWDGRCNSNNSEGTSPGSTINPTLVPLRLDSVRVDTFLCMDIDQIYNVPAS